MFIFINVYFLFINVYFLFIVKKLIFAKRNDEKKIMNQPFKIVPSCLELNMVKSNKVPEFHKKYYFINIISGYILKYKYACDNEGKIQFWTISSNMHHVKIYWRPEKSILPDILINGIHIHIIRLKYNILFRAIIAFMKLKYRVTRKLYTRKSFLCSGIFRSYEPVKHTILKYI